MQYDIAIVGGSMVGSALAVSLSCFKLRIALIEKTSLDLSSVSSTPDIRCSSINLRSEELLQKLNIWTHIISARACPYEQLEVEENWVSSIKLPFGRQTVFDSSDIGEDHLGHIVENSIIQRAGYIALQDCDNVDVFTGVDIDVIEAGDVHTIRLKDGAELSASLVIGADGGQSLVRHISGIGCFYDEYEQQVFASLVEYEGVEARSTWQRFYESGPRAFLPMADIDDRHYATLIWYDQPSVVARLSHIPDEALSAELKQCFPDRLPPIKDVISRAKFPIAKMHAHSYGTNGFILVGDAAHTINPLAGQGLNLGYQDIIALTDALFEALNEGRSLRDPVIVQRYQKERKAANQAMMMAMDVFYYGFSNDVPPLKWARAFGLGLANQLGLAKQSVMQYASGKGSGIPFPFI